MALKDWKKVEKDTWRNNKYKYIIEINKDNILNKYEVTKKTGLAPSQQRILRVFKTKIQALKYAKSYMKKH